jgi:hypothetical protein
MLKQAEALAKEAKAEWDQIRHRLDDTQSAILQARIMACVLAYSVSMRMRRNVIMHRLSDAIQTMGKKRGLWPKFLFVYVKDPGELHAAALSFRNEVRVRITALLSHANDTYLGHRWQLTSSAIANKDRLAALERTPVRHRPVHDYA